MRKDRANIFLDANVVIQAGKPPGGPILSRLVDLVRGGFVAVVTTDLTIDEVTKKHVENDYEVIKEIARPHFRKLVAEVTGDKLKDVDKKEIRRILWEKYGPATRQMFAKLNAKILSIDTIKPSQVFSTYADRSGMFSGENKKDQFPDAFIFECIKAEATEKAPITIISDDGDFKQPASAVKSLKVLGSIPELFTDLGLEIDAPDVEEFLAAQHDRILELVASEVEDWGVHVSDIMDAEIQEAKATDFKLHDIISFGSQEKEEGSILVIGAVSITADATYSHPNWETAAYDSEDKVLMPWEEVDGEKEIEIEVDFSMTILLNEEGRPDEIDEFRFTSERGLWAELEEYETYK